MAIEIHVLNGPNLNLLGDREPHIYGRDTLADVQRNCQQAAAAHGCAIDFRQTNAEHEMVQWLHELRRSTGIVLNPGAHCHYSWAVLDALKSVECPVVEVHISNVHKRELEGRPKSLFMAHVKGSISGLGIDGYRLAVEHLCALLAKPAQR